MIPRSNRSTPGHGFLSFLFIVMAIINEQVQWSCSLSHQYWMSLVAELLGVSLFVFIIIFVISRYYGIQTVSSIKGPYILFRI